MISRTALEAVIDRLASSHGGTKPMSRSAEFILRCLMELNQYKLAEELGIIVRAPETDSDAMQRGQAHG
ncbi:MAG: hypothetical protein PHS57_06005 [Alphaproteobacteria bacterium]|nr:hypothetical protein [Alphaproteobacteria bacterium]